MSGAVQVTGRVVSIKRAGAYLRLTLLAPGVAERFRPGQFAALAVGGPDTSMLLRRSFAIYRAEDEGPFGGSLEVVFAVRGKGTAWLAQRRPDDEVDVVAPLGRPFPVPKSPVPALLVGGGYGSAPLLSLALRLRERGCPVHMVLGAETGDRLFGQLDARRAAASLAVTTEDGSVGLAGRVTDVLPELLERERIGVVYACGPMGMLAAAADIARTHGIASQVAVEESMACGVGVCMTCVLPVVGDDGETRMTRSCVEGPVFGGERIRWDALGTVPADTVGAAAMRGGRR